MNEVPDQNWEENVDTASESMSKDELVQALKESLKCNEEITAGQKLLATHLKVLCYKNGGTLTYTKDEFDAAAKEDHALNMDYEVVDGKEVCELRLHPREKKADLDTL